MNKIIAASLATCSVIVLAQYGWADEDNKMGTRDWKDWDVTVGLGAEYGPVSPGIDETEGDILPIVDIEYRNKYFLNNKGLGAYLLRSEDDPELTLGVALGYREGRDEKDAPKQLKGMGDLDGTPELTVFLEREVGPVDVELELGKGLSSDGNDGFRAELSAEMETMLTDRLQVSAGPYLTYGDKNYIEKLYGVTSAQAAKSQYKQYKTKGGLENVGLEANARYKLTQNWSLMGSADYTRLMGDAKDSPIVKDEGYFTFGAAIAYTF